MWQIYAPPLLAEMAAWQIETYKRENLVIVKTPFNWPAFSRAWLIILPLLCLIIWHAMRTGVLPAPTLLPPPARWLNMGEMDNIRIAFHSEYHRAITALSLHINASHLLGNILFGSIFLYFLAKRTGYGNAFLLATVAGVAGNLLGLLFHKQVWLSVGFSTAVFAATGALAGMASIMASSKRKFLLTTGAALGLLALLGTEGENTDYTAHCAGLVCGYVGGLFYGSRIRLARPLLPNFMAFILSFCIYALGWGIAFYIT